MPSPNIWRAHGQSYRLEAGRCKKCGKLFFPPRLICSQCGHREFETAALSRHGKLLTHTVIRTPADEFSGAAPYALGVVETEDGGRLTTQIVDVDFDELKIGMPVKLEFRLITAEGHSGPLQYGHKAVPAR
jgi:uncharacterized OB-fold protein